MQGYRNNEPTSKAAWEDYVESGTLGKRQAQTYFLVVKYPNHSSAEYSRLMVKEFPELGIRCAVDTPHKRLPELKTKGLVDQTTLKICTETGREVYSWDATSKELL